MKTGWTDVFVIWSVFLIVYMLQTEIYIFILCIHLPVHILPILVKWMYSPTIFSGGSADFIDPTYLFLLAIRIQFPHVTLEASQL